MKVSKLFHWLYASVMFIPLLITALLGLAVRSENNFQPIEVQAQDYEVVDFNQKVNNGNFYNFDNWNLFDTNATSYNINSNQLEISIINDTYSYWQYGFYQTIPTLSLGNKYVVRVNISSAAYTSYRVEILSGNATSLSNGNNSVLIEPTVDYGKQLGFYPVGTYNVDTSYVVQNVQVFDLTQMFGRGNEPTIEQFNTWYTNDYYEYTTSKKELLNVGTTTYSDTDIGSQMVYTLYNATDKYFNFNQFLGIGDLLNWFQLNVFNGNAPLGFIIFWNLLIYWLLVSIAWLIFDIAMYVPKLAHRWLDRASLE